MRRAGLGPLILGVGRSRDGRGLGFEAGRGLPSDDVVVGGIGGEEEVEALGILAADRQVEFLGGRPSGEEVSSSFGS